MKSIHRNGPADTRRHLPFWPPSSMREKVSDISSTLSGYYYERLLDIWTHQDRTYWTSISTFLVVESILFVALFQSLDNATLDARIPSGISVLGLVVSLLWLLVSGRWRKGILLLENQLRHIELELFRKRLSTATGVKGYFPMYFWGSRSVMLKGYDDQLMDFEIAMKEYYEETQVHPPQRFRFESLIRKMENGLSGWSSNRIITYVLPNAFMFAWSLGLVSTLSSINGYWLILLPGIMIILVVAAVSYSALRKWNLE